MSVRYGVYVQWMEKGVLYSTMSTVPTKLANADPEGQKPQKRHDIETAPLQTPQFRWLPDEPMGGMRGKYSVRIKPSSKAKGLQRVKAWTETGI